ncbi:MAG: lysine--tRNA ligase [Firmicutes bacterium]|nr:lysine--tRNA ligase [Bacillota bacterium]
MADEKNNVQAPALDESEQYQIRKDKLAGLREAGRDPYTITKFDQNAYSAQLKTDFDYLQPEENSGKTVSVAGRLMAKRVMGKASFAHIRDDKGDLQLYVRRDELGDEEYAAFKKLDIGDIIGVTGEVFKTRTGELSVRADELTLLSKSLRPLPEKFHGLTDTELRYRQRYVDLIMNPDVKETFRKRSAIMSGIRHYMDSLGFLEVETPILTPFEIGASARPFYTHHNTLDMDMVLRIETELYLKRLIVGGIDRVYEIGRIFRNEGMDPRHNPEFTSIELYQAYTDYQGMMDIVEGLFKYLADTVCGTRQIHFMDRDIDLDNWTRMTMREAVKKYSGVDYNDWKTDEDAIEAAKAHKVELPEIKTRGNILAEFFDAFVEDKLVQPTFIYEYPVDISPLAKRCPGDPEFTERFEFFIDCMEFGNAFSELNDPLDQRGRFERQVAERLAIEPGARCQVDYDFVNALEYGMPPTGGLGIGVDRLVMLLTDSASIRDVLLFPTMKPEGAGKASGSEAAPASAAENAEAAPVIDFSKVEIEPMFADYVAFEDFSKCDFRAVKVKACEAVKKSKKLLQFTLDDGTGTDRTILSGIHAFYEPEELVGKTLIAITNLPPRSMMGIDSCGMLLSALHTEEGEEKLNLLIVDPHIPAGAKLY